jgi:hypothetical protein
LFTGSSTPMRTTPARLGAAWLVPSAVEPKIASASVAPAATDGVSSIMLLASTKSSGTSKSAASSRVSSSAVVSAVVIVVSCLSPSPVTTVVVVLVGKPSVTSPTMRESTLSWHASGAAAGASGAGAKAGVAGADRVEVAGTLVRAQVERRGQRVPHPPPLRRVHGGTQSYRLPGASRRSSRFNVLAPPT